MCTLQYRKAESVCTIEYRKAYFMCSVQYGDALSVVHFREK